MSSWGKYSPRRNKIKVFTKTSSSALLIFPPKLLCSTSDTSFGQGSLFGIGPLGGYICLQQCPWSGPCRERPNTKCKRKLTTGNQTEVGTLNMGGFNLCTLWTEFLVLQSVHQEGFVCSVLIIKTRNPTGRLLQSSMYFPLSWLKSSCKESQDFCLSLFHHECLSFLCVCVHCKGYIRGFVFHKCQ